MVGPSLDTTTSLHLHHHKPPSSSAATTTIKFLCSYGGKIIPRFPDGKLRYHGGETRVLAVDRSISFSELLLKLGELCGTRVNLLRCQLPTEDLDALVSITSDEDLVNLMEEYNRAANQKIRVFLSLPKKLSPPSSTSSSSSSSASSSSSSNSYAATNGSTASSSSASTPRYYHQISKAVAYPVKKIHHPHNYGYYGNPSQYPTWFTTGTIGNNEW
ncbi:uncharacterized protein LOC126654647 [Mercurialis annua]|uniref:uncharacterized protein LOC126654647 n=1 Tax=Mercurialis annua TaxID=3986 RepID=UPI00215F615D|nr:uncharacterized protein LOC126654647 [Mercurialis annua]